MWYINFFNSFMNYDKLRFVYFEVKCVYMCVYKLLMLIWCIKVLYLYDLLGEIYSLFVCVVFC